MEKLKVLSAVVLAIMTLKNESCTNRRDSDCKTLRIVNKSNTVSLSESQYSIRKNEIGFEITIKNENSLNEVATMDNPTIFVCFEDERIESKGNPLLNSSIPAGVKSFFPLSFDNKVSFSDGNKILITLVSKVVRQ